MPAHSAYDLAYTTFLNRSSSPDLLSKVDAVTFIAVSFSSTAMINTSFLPFLRRNVFPSPSTSVVVTDSRCLDINDRTLAPPRAFAYSVKKEIEIWKEKEREDE